MSSTKSSDTWKKSRTGLPITSRGVFSGRLQPITSLLRAKRQTKEEQKKLTQTTEDYEFSLLDWDSPTSARRGEIIDGIRKVQLYTQWPARSHFLCGGRCITGGEAWHLVASVPLCGAIEA
eukprot:4370270-Amphidinium_carterae.1